MWVRKDELHGSSLGGKESAGKEESSRGVLQSEKATRVVQKH